MFLPTRGETPESGATRSGAAGTRSGYSLSLTRFVRERTPARSLTRPSRAAPHRTGIYSGFSGGCEYPRRGHRFLEVGSSEQDAPRGSRSALSLSPQVPQLDQRGLELPEEFKGLIPVQGRRAARQHGDGATLVLDELGGRQFGHSLS